MMKKRALCVARMEVSLLPMNGHTGVPVLPLELVLQILAFRLVMAI